MDYRVLKFILWLIAGYRCNRVQQYHTVIAAVGSGVVDATVVIRVVSIYLVTLVDITT